MGTGAILRLLLAAIAIAALAGPAALAAERIGVRAWAHPGYGRIVFDWPRTVAHEAHIDAGVLRVSFAEPMSAGFAAVTRYLGDYVDAIALDASGKIVTARLKAPYRLRAFTSGPKVVIDLLPPKAAAGAQEKKKEPDEGRSQAAIPVASPAAPPALRPPVRLVPPAAPSAVDRPGPTPASAPEARDPAPAAPIELPIHIERQSEYGRLVFEWPRKTGFTVDRDGRTVTIRFDAPARVDIGALRKALPRQISAVDVHPSTRGLELGLVVPERAQLRYFHSGSHVMLDVVTKIEQPLAAGNAAAPPRTLVRDTRTEATAETEAERPLPLPLVSVDVTRADMRLTIGFNWREAVNATVFRRGTILWVVFDKPARLDLAPIRITGGSLFETVEQRKSAPGISVVRMPMTMSYRTAVRRKGSVWILEIGPTLERRGDALPLRAERLNGKGASIIIGAREAAPVISLVDPEIGDTIFAVPTGAPGGVMPALRRFPEFELLESAQGVAVRPLDERVRVASGEEGVRVFRSGGLTVSDPSVFAGPRENDADVPKLLDFAAWKYGPAEDFQRIEHELLQYVAEPSGLRRSAARLGLARFYVAHGMAAEGLGVIDEMLREDPAMLRDASVRALRGVARCLVGHYVDAAADLEHPSLRNEPQIRPWRARIAAARGDWRRAHQLIDDTDAIFNAYPTRFAVHFGLIAAEASLAVGDLDTAAIRLDVLEAMPATGAQLDHSAYLRGYLLKKRGEIDKAIELWQTVIAMGDRRSRARASLALVNAQLEKKAITLATAIERLEQLRFAWRDDVFEFDLLHRLGQLYAQNTDYRNALVTLRRAATYFREIEGAEALTEEMRALFKAFYLDGDADTLAPVVALGLFNEFRELTPPGEQGDLMYRKLADRLVSVDLLAEAAELLDHQVRFRLEGEAKARVGARLAKIRLMSRDAAAALAALEKSADAKISEELSDRRRRLKAQALAESGDLAQALATLGDDTTEETQLLKAQFLWRSGEWSQAARALARITAPFGAGTLGPREAELLLRRAVALSLAGDQPGIEYLRSRFGPAMAKTSRAAAFAAVVGRKPEDSEDYAVLARQAAQLDTFTTFMKRIDAGAPPVAVPDIPPQSAAIN